MPGDKFIYKKKKGEKKMPLRMKHCLLCGQEMYEPLLKEYEEKIKKLEKELLEALKKLSIKRIV